MAGAMTGQIPSPLRQPPTPMQYPQDPAACMNTSISTPQRSDAPDMIPIPGDMKRILATQQMNAGQPYPVPQQPFAQNPALLRQQQQIQQQQQQQQAGCWNPYFGLGDGTINLLDMGSVFMSPKPSFAANQRDCGSLTGFGVK